MSDKLANPAPLGLLAFGVTTVLLNLHNAGFYPLDSMILAMGFAYGGIAQTIVGVMEFRKGRHCPPWVAGTPSASLLWPRGSLAWCLSPPTCSVARRWIRV